MELNPSENFVQRTICTSQEPDDPDEVIRPGFLKDFIGQELIKESLHIYRGGEKKG